ncbi:hypothetical protein SAMN05421676_11583, partial [Salinibacillus kushneri]
YNGLREEIGELEKKVAAMQKVEEGKSKVGKAVLNWGGLIIGILGLAAAFLKVFI